MPVTNTGGAVKAGTVAHFAASTAPAGWLKANGAAISRSAYAALFAAIGTTYGAGDGLTTFNVPDLRGEFVRSLDDGRGVDTGRAIGTAQAHMTQAHGHELNEVIVQGGSGAVVSNNGGSGTGRVVGSYGGSETRPRNVALLACIKF